MKAESSAKDAFTGSPMAEWEKHRKKSKLAEAELGRGKFATQALKGCAVGDLNWSAEMD
jgi:hypothetical protein